jgi:RNA-directed DNA polymerase
MSYINWKNQLREDKKVRKYLHIDDPINLDNDANFKKVCKSLDKIKSHQFLPFLKKFDKQIRYRRDKTGTPHRKVKTRPLVYASHIDSHIYSYYNFILERDYESFLQKTGLFENIIAYRKIRILDRDKGKNNINFAKEVFDHIKKLGDCVVITLDIEQFFDNLDHKILLKKLRDVKLVDKIDGDFYKVFKSLTTYKYVLQKEFKENKIKQKIKNSNDEIYIILKKLLKQNKSGKGIPQGSTISGLFANIYLIDFDKEMITTYPQIFYRRYSDDLAFICKKGEETNLLDFITKTINQNRLQINLEKSFISYFQKNNDGKISCVNVTDGKGSQKGRNYVDYLGFEFDGDRILLRKNTIHKLRNKQIEKVEKQYINQIRRIKAKIKQKVLFKKNINYLERSKNIIDNSALNKQITNVTKARNKVKRNHSQKN